MFHAIWYLQSDFDLQNMSEYGIFEQCSNYSQSITFLSIQLIVKHQKKKKIGGFFTMIDIGSM